MMMTKTCHMPEQHNAHMDLNGECPWCGAYDPEQALDLPMENTELFEFLEARHG